MDDLKAKPNSRCLFSTFRVVSDPHKISNGPHHSWKEILVGPLILKLWTWHTTWVSGWALGFSSVCTVSCCKSWLSSCELFFSLETFELVKGESRNPVLVFIPSGTRATNLGCYPMGHTVCWYSVYSFKEGRGQKTYTIGQWATFFWPWFGALGERFRLWLREVNWLAKPNQLGLGREIYILPTCVFSDNIYKEQPAVSFYFI